MGNIGTKKYDDKFRYLLLEGYLNEEENITFNAYCEQFDIPKGSTYTILNNMKKKDIKLYNKVKLKMAYSNANNKKNIQYNNIFFSHDTLSNKKFTRKQLADWFLEKEGHKIYPEMTMGELIDKVIKYGAIVNREVY